MKDCNVHHMTTGGVCRDCGTPWSAMTANQHEDAVRVATPPTPDPRERGVNYAAMMAARDENERDAARVADAYLADRGVRWSPGAAQMAADLLALEALRAPAPSEAVGFLCAGRSGGWTGCDRQCAMCRNVQTPHPTSAPSEAVAWGLTLNGEIQDKQVWRDRESAERALKNTRSYVMQTPRVGYDIAALYTHPAPARGVTEAMVERAMGVECGSTHHEHHPPDCRRCWQAKLTAILTPDAEGGA